MSELPNVIAVYLFFFVKKRGKKIRHLVKSRITIAMLLRLGIILKLSMLQNFVISSLKSIVGTYTYNMSSRIGFAS